MFPTGWSCTGLRITGLRVLSGLFMHIQDRAQFHFSGHNSSLTHISEVVLSGSSIMVSLPWGLHQAQLFAGTHPLLSCDTFCSYPIPIHPLWMTLIVLLLWSLRLTQTYFLNSCVCHSAVQNLFTCCLYNEGAKVSKPLTWWLTALLGSDTNSCITTPSSSSPSFPRK